MVCVCLTLTTYHLGDAYTTVVENIGFASSLNDATNDLYTQHMGNSRDDDERHAYSLGFFF